MACDCTPEPVSVHNFPVATKHGGDWVFLALTGPIPTTALKRVNLRSYVELFKDEFDFRFAFQTSDNLVAWTGGQEPNGGSTEPKVDYIGSTTYSESTGGLENSFIDDTQTIATGDLYARFGVLVRDGASDNDPGAFLMSMKLHFQNW